MIVLAALPESEEGELRPVAMSQLVAERLVGEQSVEEAEAAGAFWRIVNPDPLGNTDHLRLARAAYLGYFRNDRGNFGYSILLGSGSRSGSTTQFELCISYDSVVACIMVPRPSKELHDMVTDTLQVRDAML